MISFTGLKKFDICTLDKKMAPVLDLVFDDDSFVIRYLVTRGGAWLAKEKTLLSPFLTRNVDIGKRRINLNETYEKLESFPRVEDHQTVSREMEQKYADHAFTPYYWYGGLIWGAYASPYDTDSAKNSTGDIKNTNTELREMDKNHLRSVNEITGYGVIAKDGEVGDISDVVVDEHDWSVRYFVVNTGSWLLGRQFLVSPEWIDSVDWASSNITFDVTKDKIKESPEYKPSEAINRAYEVRLFDYYGRPTYWSTTEQVSSSNLFYPKQNVSKDESRSQT